MSLLPVIPLMTNCQESSATVYSPKELLMGRATWFLHSLYSRDWCATVRERPNEQEEKAIAMLQRVGQRQWDKKNKN